MLWKFTGERGFIQLEGSKEVPRAAIKYEVDLEKMVAFAYPEEEEQRLSQARKKHLGHLVVGLDWNTEPVKSEVGNEPAVTLRWLQ